ncbi:MAG TPA: type II toxin-antitoxin system prevent-host-death family antitoxin [Chthonomonadaceae bacterium]|nr:type II toxin-antitoxin system prevent-host-death family antitoxin [Chthonomonadaceae bacterium]
MTQVTLEEAEETLPQLIQIVQQGEEIIITADSKPIARLTSIAKIEPKEKPRPQFGSGKGLLLYMAPDFDAPLDDFKEYME